MKAGTFLEVCRGHRRGRGDGQVLMTHGWSRDDPWLQLGIVASIYWRNHAFGRWMVLASHVKAVFSFGLDIM